MKAGDNMSNAEEIVIYSPMDGDVAELSTCPDQVFASGMLGKGVVIKPAKGEVVAPCDGVIESIFDTKHAIGMVGANEAEILIHVGLDTVNLNGEGFTVETKDGAAVHKGDKLLNADLDIIKAKATSECTLVLVTNLAEGQNIKRLKHGPVKAGEAIFAICK